jgi:hypothetical protein
MILNWRASAKKSQTCWRRTSGFFIAVPHESKLSSAHQQKSLVCLRPTWLFFVAEGDEISNHELVSDVAKIIDLLNNNKDMIIDIH